MVANRYEAEGSRPEPDIRDLLPDIDGRLDGRHSVTAGESGDGSTASPAGNSWRSDTCRGGGTKARERVEDRRLAARARYPPPAVGLPPWYRFATKALLLRYIAGGGERYTN